MKAKMDRCVRSVVAVVMWHCPSQCPPDEAIELSFLGIVAPRWVKLAESMQRGGEEALLARCRWMLCSVVPRLRVEACLQSQSSGDDLLARRSSSFFSSDLSVLRTRALSAVRKRQKLVKGSDDEVIDDLFRFVCDDSSDIVELEKEIACKFKYATCHLAAYRSLKDLAKICTTDRNYRLLVDVLLEHHDLLSQANTDEEINYLTPFLGCGFACETDLQRAFCALVATLMQFFENKVPSSVSLDAMMYLGLLSHPWDSTDLQLQDPHIFLRAATTFFMAKPPQMQEPQGSLLEVASKSFVLPNHIASPPQNVHIAEDEHGFGIQVDASVMLCTADVPWSLERKDELLDMPRVFYFEVSFALCTEPKSCYAVGLATTKGFKNSMPVHGECLFYDSTAQYFNLASGSSPFGLPYNVGDTIGCGVIVNENAVFFTKNGAFLGIADRKCVAAGLYPMWAAEKADVQNMVVNFGVHHQFRYDFTRLEASCRQRNVTPQMLQDSVQMFLHFTASLCNRLLSSLEGSSSVVLRQGVCQLIDVIVEFIQTASRRLAIDSSRWRDFWQRQQISLLGVLDVLLKSLSCKEILATTHHRILSTLAECLCLCPFEAVHNTCNDLLVRVFGYAKHEDIDTAFRNAATPKALDVVSRLFEIGSGATSWWQAVKISPVWSDRKPVVKGKGLSVSPTEISGHSSTRFGFQIIQADRAAGLPLTATCFVGVLWGKIPPLFDPESPAGCYFVVQNGQEQRDSRAKKNEHFLAAPGESSRFFGNREIVWVEIDRPNKTLKFSREKCHVSYTFADFPQGTVVPFVWLPNDEMTCTLIDTEAASGAMVPWRVHASKAVSALQRLHTLPCLCTEITNTVVNAIEHSSQDLPMAFTALGLLGGELSAEQCYIKDKACIVQILRSGERLSEVFLEGDEDRTPFKTATGSLVPQFVPLPLLTTAKVHPHTYKAIRACFKALASTVKQLFVSISVAVPNEEEKSRIAIITLEEAEIAQLCVDMVSLVNSKVVTAVPDTFFFSKRGLPPDAQIPTPRIAFVEGAKPVVVMCSSPITTTKNCVRLVLMGPKRGEPLRETYVGVSTAAVPSTDSLLSATTFGVPSTSSPTFTFGATVPPSLMVTRMGSATKNGNILLSGDVVNIQVDRAKECVQVSIMRDGTAILLGTIAAVPLPSADLTPFVVLSSGLCCLIAEDSDELRLPNRPTCQSLKLKDWNPTKCSWCGTKMLRQEWYHSAVTDTEVCATCFRGWAFPADVFLAKSQVVSLTSSPFILSRHSPSIVALNSVVEYDAASPVKWDSTATLNGTVSGKSSLAQNEDCIVATTPLPCWGRTQVDFAISHLVGVQGHSLRRIAPFVPKWNACNNSVSCGFSQAFESTVALTGPGFYQFGVVSRSVGPVFYGVTTLHDVSQFKCARDVVREINTSVWGVWSDTKKPRLVDRTAYFVYDTAAQSLLAAPTLDEGIGGFTSCMPSLRPGSPPHLFAFCSDPATVTLLPGLCSCNERCNHLMKPFAITVAPSDSQRLNPTAVSCDAPTFLVQEPSSSTENFVCGELLSVTIDEKHDTCTLVRDGITVVTKPLPPHFKSQHLRVFVHLPLAGTVVKLQAECTLPRQIGRVVRIAHQEMFLVKFENNWTRWCSRQDVRVVGLPMIPSETPSNSQVAHVPEQSAALVRGRFIDMVDATTAKVQCGNAMSKIPSDKLFSLPNEDFAVAPKPIPELFAFLNTREARRFEVGRTFRQSGNSSYHGIMFDVVAHEQVTITKILCYSCTSGQHAVQLYARKGSMCPVQRDASEWVKLVDTHLTLPNADVFPIDVPNFSAEAEDVFALYINTDHNCGVGHYAEDDQCRGSVGDIIDSDGVLDIKMGQKSESANAFGDINSQSRGFRGSLVYEVTRRYRTPDVPDGPLQRAADDTAFSEVEQTIECQPPKQVTMKHEQVCEFSVSSETPFMLRRISVPITDVAPRHAACLVLYRQSLDGDSKAVAGRSVVLSNAVLATLPCDVRCPEGVTKFKLVAEDPARLICTNSECAVKEGKLEIKGLTGSVSLSHADAKVPRAQQQGSTEFVAGKNYQQGSNASYNGIMFDLSSTVPVVIDEIYWVSQTTSNGVNAKLFWRDGSMLGEERNSSAWQEVISTSVDLVDGQLYSLGPLKLQMKPGEKYAVYVNTSSSCGVRFFNNSDGPLPAVMERFDDDGVLIVYAGRKSENVNAFADIPRDPRGFRGKIVYHCFSEPSSRMNSQFPIQDGLQAVLTTRVLLALKQFIAHGPIAMIDDEGKDLIHVVASVARSDLEPVDTIAYETSLQSALMAPTAALVNGSVSIPIGTTKAAASLAPSVVVGDTAVDVTSGIQGVVLKIDKDNNNTDLVVAGADQPVRVSTLNLLPLKLCAECLKPFLSSASASCCATRVPHQFPLNAVEASRRRLKGLLAVKDPSMLDAVEGLLNGDRSRLQNEKQYTAGPPLVTELDPQHCCVTFDIENLRARNGACTTWFTCAGQRWLLEACFAPNGMTFRGCTDFTLRSASSSRAQVVRLECVQTSLGLDEFVLLVPHQRTYLCFNGLVSHSDLEAILLRGCPVLEMHFFVKDPNTVQIPEIPQRAAPENVTMNWRLITANGIAFLPASRGVTTPTAARGVLSGPVPLNKNGTTVFTNGYCQTEYIFAIVPVTDALLASTTMLDVHHVCDNYATFQATLNCGGKVLLIVSCADRTVELYAAGSGTKVNFDDAQIGGAHEVCLYAFCNLSPFSLEVTPLDGAVKDRDHGWSGYDKNKVTVSNNTAECYKSHAGQCVVGSQLQEDRSSFTVIVRRKDLANGQPLGGGHYVGVALSTFNSFGAHYANIRDSPEVWAVQDVVDADSQKRQAPVKPIRDKSLFFCNTRVTVTVDRSARTMSLRCDDVDFGVVFSDLPACGTLHPFVRLDNSNSGASLWYWPGGASSDAAAGQAVSMQVDIDDLLATYPLFRSIFLQLDVSLQTALRAAWTGNGDTDLTVPIQQLLDACTKNGVFQTTSDGAVPSTLREALAGPLRALQKAVLKQPSFCVVPKRGVAVAIPSDFAVVGLLANGSGLHVERCSPHKTEAFALIFVDEAQCQAMRLVPSLVAPHTTTLDELDWWESNDHRYRALLTRDHDTTLDALLCAATPLSWCQREAIFFAVACAVEHYHMHGKPHGHVTARNITISFGEMGSKGPMAHVSRIPYSSSDPFVLPYMPPEQLRGEAPSMGSDLWSLGVLFWQLFSRNYELPFGKACNADAMLGRILSVVGVPQDEPESQSAYAAFVAQRLASLPGDAMKLDDATSKLLPSIFVHNPKNRGQVPGFLLLPQFSNVMTADRFMSEIQRFTTGRDKRQTGSGSYNGIMFDIVAKQREIEFTELAWIPDTSNEVTVRLFVRPGTHAGFERSADGWQEIVNERMRLRNREEKSVHFSAIRVKPGQKLAVFLHTTNSSGVLFYTEEEGIRKQIAEVEEENEYFGVTVGRKVQSDTPFTNVQNERRYFRGAFMFSFSMAGDSRRTPLVESRDTIHLPDRSHEMTEGRDVALGRDFAEGDIAVPSGAMGVVVKKTERGALCAFEDATALALRWVLINCEVDDLREVSRSKNVGVERDSQLRRLLEMHQSHSMNCSYPLCLEWVGLPHPQVTTACSVVSTPLPFSGTCSVEVNFHCVKGGVEFGVVLKRQLASGTPSTRTFVTPLAAGANLQAKAIIEIDRESATAKLDGQLLACAVQPNEEACIIFKTTGEAVDVSVACGQATAVAKQSSDTFFLGEPDPFMCSFVVPHSSLSSTGGFVSPLLGKATNGAFAVLRKVGENLSVDVRRCGVPPAKVEVRLLHPSGAQGDIVSNAAEQHLTVPMKELEPLEYRTAQGELVFDVAVSFPPTVSSQLNIANTVEWLPLSNASDMAINGRRVAHCHPVHESVCAASLKFNGGLHIVELAISLPMTGKLCVSVSDTVDSMSAGERCVQFSNRTAVGACTVVVDCERKTVTYHVADSSTTHALPDDASLMVQSAHLASRVTIATWRVVRTATKSQDSLWDALCERYGVDANLSRHFVDEVVMPVQRSNRLAKPAAPKRLFTPETVCQGLTNYIAFLCSSVTESLLQRPLVISPHYALQLAGNLPAQRMEYVFQQISQTDTTSTRQLLAASLDGLSFLLERLSPDEIRCRIQLLREVVLCHGPLYAKVICDPALVGDFEIGIARLCCVLTRKTRHVAMALLTDHLGHVKAVTPHLFTALRPVIAMVDSMHAKSKSITRSVYLGVELLIEVVKIHRAMQLPPPLPGSGSHIPHHLISALCDTSANMEKEVPLPALVQFAALRHAYLFETSSGAGPVCFRVRQSMPLLTGARIFEILVLRQLTEGNYLNIGLESGETKVVTFVARAAALATRCRNGTEIPIEAPPLQRGDYISLVLDAEANEYRFFVNGTPLTKLSLPKDVKLQVPFVETSCDDIISGFVTDAPAMHSLADVSGTFAPLLHAIPLSAMIDSIDSLGAEPKPFFAENEVERIFGKLLPQNKVFFSELAECLEMLPKRFAGTLDDILDSASTPICVPLADMGSFPHVQALCGTANVAASTPDEASCDLSPLRPYFRVLDVLDGMLGSLFDIVNLDDDRGILARLWNKLKVFASPDTRQRIKAKVLLPLSQRGGSKASVSLHLFAARPSKRRNAEATLQSSVFGQLYKQMSASPINTFYTSPMFQARFVGLGSQDAGGPYREALSRIAAELLEVHPLGQFNMNPLFVVTSNGNCVMPSTTMTSLQHRDMYRFFGRIMGCCLLSVDILSADFPTFFWKVLLEDSVTVGDLASIDRGHLLATQTESAICALSDEELFEHFEGLEEKWDASPQEPSVSRSHKMYTMIQQLELHRYDAPINAIREGLCSVVPLPALRALHWKDVSDAVCGEPVVSVEALRASINSELPPEIEQMFWCVVTAMSDSDRSMLLRFATGQRRLPLKEKMKLTHNSGATLNSMPTSRTCFFSMALPPYSSQQKMTQQVLYAIRYCVAIDADGRTDEGLEVVEVD